MSETEQMTDAEIDRFMDLFRQYRTHGKLPPNERAEFKELAAKFKAQKETFDG